MTNEMKYPEKRSKNQLNVFIFNILLSTFLSIKNIKTTEKENKGIIVTI